MFVFFLKIMEFSQHSTGLSFGNLVDGLPGALHRWQTNDLLSCPSFHEGTEIISFLEKTQNSHTNYRILYSLFLQSCF